MERVIMLGHLRKDLSSAVARMIIDNYYIKWSLDFLFQGAFNSMADCIFSVLDGNDNRRLNRKFRAAERDPLRRSGEKKSSLLGVLSKHGFKLNLGCSIRGSEIIELSR